MAFVNGAVSAFSAASVAPAKCVSIRGSAVAAPRRAARAQTNTITMDDTYWEGKFPPSEVLGLGKNIPSGIFNLSSAVALILGCFSVYNSELTSPLMTDGSIRPDFIIGSLLVPISWGLHVAGWIQVQNKK